MKRPKTDGFSRRLFRLGVEPFHHTAGKLSLGPETVQQQRPMPA
jgi:hypothetical protein